MFCYCWSFNLKSWATVMKTYKLERSLFVDRIGILSYTHSRNLPSRTKTVLLILILFTGLYSQHIKWEEAMHHATCSSFNLTGDLMSLSHRTAYVGKTFINQDVYPRSGTHTISLMLWQMHIILQECIFHLGTWSRYVLVIGRYCVLRSHS